VFFAGDLLAKSSHASSLSVIDFLTEHHTVDGRETLFPVRGNHDQLIVQWRAWREWFESLRHPLEASAAPRLFPAALHVLRHTLPSFFSSLLADTSDAIANDKLPPVSTGREFLQLLEAEWMVARQENGVDPEEYVSVARKRAVGTWREVWWRRIPEPIDNWEKKQQWLLFGDHYWLAR
jgi:hypothetical protein